MEGLGELIKSERLKTKISIKEISEKTNIPQKTIKALENNDFKLIPGKFYLKNFIKNYLKVIGADTQHFFKKYKSIIDSIPFQQENKADFQYSLRYSKFKNRNTLVTFLIILLLVVAAVWIIYKNFDAIKKFLKPDPSNQIVAIPSLPLPLIELNTALMQTVENHSVYSPNTSYVPDYWPIDIHIELKKRSWITVIRDKRKIISKAFEKDDILRLQGYKFTLMVENGKSVSISVNGKAVSDSKLVDGFQKIQFDPENLSLIHAQ